MKNAFFSVAVCAALTCAAGEGALPINIGDRREVMWDDFLVDTAKTTARRVLHQPEYRGDAPCKASYRL